MELVPDIYRSDFTEYFGRAEEAFARRHDIVNNVWIYRGDEHADYIGMRGLPRRKREDANEPYTLTQVKHSDLVAVLAEFDDLSHWLHIWSDRIDTFGQRGGPPEA